MSFIRENNQMILMSLCSKLVIIGAFVQHAIYWMTCIMPSGIMLLQCNIYGMLRLLEVCIIHFICQFIWALMQELMIFIVRSSNKNSNYNTSLSRITVHQK